MAPGTEGGNRGDGGLRPDEAGDVKSSMVKTGPDSVNDLAALLSRAALSESQYREFSPPDRASQQSPPVSPARDHATEAQGGVHFRPTGAEQPEAAGSATTQAGPGGARGEVFEASAPGVRRSNDDSDAIKARPHADGSRNPRTKFDDDAESRWSVLGRALSGESDDSPGQLIQALSNSVSIPFEFMAAISGGTGVTTILATLARCFAARGERVLLADHGAASLLPLYFGAAALGTGDLQSFSMPGNGGSIDTVNRSEREKQPTSPSTRMPGEQRKASLVSTIRNAAVRSNRLLLDAGTLNERDVEALRPAKQFGGLVPLVPDLSCVFGLLRLERALRRREASTHRSSPVFYILNKFDSSLALHRDVKASLERQLGDRLLPLTLRRSDAVAEALAEGMTVIDYCPETGIAQDFVRLADWLLESAATSFRERGE